MSWPAGWKLSRAAADTADAGEAGAEAEVEAVVEEGVGIRSPAGVL